MPKLQKPLPLHPVDAATCQESGLTPATIRANHLRSGEQGLEFRYPNIHGEVNGRVRTRIREPEGDTRYLQPRGTGCWAYFPVGCCDSLREGDDATFIVEGEKKALALSQLGLTVVGIGGINNYKVKGKEELCDDLKTVKWSGRRVYIVFDCEPKPETQWKVDSARRRLAALLREAGAAEVYAVELPPGANGEKMGVDDFIVAHGAAAYAELVKQSQAVPPVETNPLTQASGRTDSANAARLIAKFGHILRWVGPWDKWLIWDGKRWRIGAELQIHNLAKQVSAALWKELGASVAKGGLDRETVSAMFSFARASNNAPGITAMVSLARSEPGVAIQVDQLDSDPWLLNVENGTGDLRTGKLREHRPEDFITKLAPVKYDPDAECPTWTNFLDVIFDGDDELVTYVQRLVGYSITGVVKQHVLPFLYGTGANGKSTLCELLEPVSEPC